MFVGKRDPILTNENTESLSEYPKKCDLTDCNNWRGLTLLSVVGKTFCTVILLRMLLKNVDNRLLQLVGAYILGAPVLLAQAENAA